MESIFSSGTAALNWGQTSTRRQWCDHLKRWSSKILQNLSVRSIKSTLEIGKKILEENVKVAPIKKVLNCGQFNYELLSCTTFSTFQGELMEVFEHHYETTYVRKTRHSQSHINHPPTEIDLVRTIVIKVKLLS